MAKALYDGVNGVARKVTKMYDGVGGVARKVTKAYDGVNGVARQYFSDGGYPRVEILSSNNTTTGMKDFDEPYFERTDSSGGYWHIPFRFIHSDECAENYYCPQENCEIRVFCEVHDDTEKIINFISFGAGGIGTDIGGDTVIIVGGDILNQYTALQDGYVDAEIFCRDAACDNASITVRVTFGDLIDSPYV